MGEPPSAVAEEEWAADMLYGCEPSAAPATESLACAEDTDVPASATEPESSRERGDVVANDDDGDNDPGGEPVDLDQADDARQQDPEQRADDANAGAKKTAAVLGAGLAVAVAGIAAALVIFSDHPSLPPQRAAPITAAAAPTPVPPSAAPPPDQDQAIPFTASANCPAGSTSAQALTDTTTDSAWVCVRGAQGAEVDGQVLRIDLGRSYLLTAVSVTPGWVAKTPGGKDEWLQHRVVTRLQYIFNDDQRSIFTQDTANTHGPVTTALPQRVLASRVTVLILQTSRPPASPLPSTDPSSAAQPDFLDSVLGANGPAAPEATQTSQPDPLAPSDSDPVDATFAVAQMKFF